jgi:hypothetical protein
MRNNSFSLRLEGAPWGEHSTDTPRYSLEFVRIIAPEKQIINVVSTATSDTRSA